ncbi:MFS transporter, partial [Escherichia coli]|nr:MFS transporter [Escherichia coli]
MIPSSPRARRLAGTLYVYAFLTDLVLLYPVYALLFADTGLSVGQISSLFVI